MVSSVNGGTPYEQLLNDLEMGCLAGVSEQEVKNVVKHFETVISSNRVCSHIKTLEGLIKILEARGVLKPSDVIALEKVAELLQRPAGLKRIQEYLNIQPNLKNSWSYMLSPQPLLEKSHSPTATNPVADKIFSVISEKIGSSWRLFARALSIRESELDQIDRQNPKDSESATKEVLELFRRKNPNEDHIKNS